MDPALASILCSAIAASAAMYGVHRTTRQDRKIAETHRTLTVNHHSSDEPTVLDRLDSLTQQVKGANTRIDRLERKVDGQSTD